MVHFILPNIWQHVVVTVPVSLMLKSSLCDLLMLDWSWRNKSMQKFQYRNFDRYLVWRLTVNGTRHMEFVCIWSYRV